MFIQPMLAKKTADNATFPVDNYLFEVKWDGIRAIINVADKVTIFSRSGNDITAQFPEIVSAFNLQPFARQVTYDAELVVFINGVPSFPHITSRLHLGDDTGRRHGSLNFPATAMVFDTVRFDNEDITHRQFQHRRNYIKDLVEGPNIRMSRIHKDPYKLMDHVLALEMEGIIAKKAKSPYRPGKRTNDWLKFKLMYEETVEVYGYTEGLGKRAGYFGALLIRGLDGSEIGKVGTGFTDEVLDHMTAKLWTREPFEKSPGVYVLGCPFKIKVKGMKKNLSGAIREPRFIRTV